MNEKRPQVEEKHLKAIPGMPVLIFSVLLHAAAFAAVIYGSILLDSSPSTSSGIVIFVAGMVYLCLGWVVFPGLKVIKPREAMVLTLFGKYIGTLDTEGFYFVNPFVSSVAPAEIEPTTGAVPLAKPAIGKASGQFPVNRKISLKAMTLNNSKQKINDLLGNPIEIGIVVIWRVVNTAKAVFNVDNYTEFLSIQSDSSLRNIVRMYPYDVSTDGEEKSLRGSSQEIADKIRDEIQKKVEIAGLEILEARITYLAYAPEIAAAMLQRQQASAIIDARKMIVDGAVGMVEMALAKLNENNIVTLDDERKAAMVSNLLVVLCGNRDAQPVVNSGSIY
jgi:regulator of protease activity HflC (stomatin/prohibitin superfamily)